MKTVPYIKVVITNYVKDGQGGIKVSEDERYSAPCVGFREKLNFNKAVRLEFINKDKKLIDDVLNISFFMQTSETDIDFKNSVFVGEVFFPWKDLLSKPAAYQILAGAALVDSGNKCLKKVQG